MEVIDRLAHAVTTSGLKQNHVAAEAGISPTKLSKILKGKQAVSVADFMAIARAIKVDPARLVSDGDLVVDLETLRTAVADSRRLHEILEQWLPEGSSAPPAPLLFAKPARKQIVAPVRAAANPNAEMIAELETERKRIPRQAWNRNARIIARVVGDSMDDGEDAIADGELAYLKPTRSSRTANNHIALVRRGDGLYLKRFEMSGHMIRLVSANDQYDTIVIDARVEELQIYGFVVDHGSGAD